MSATAFWAIGFLLVPANQRWRAAVEQRISAACKEHSTSTTHAHSHGAHAAHTNDTHTRSPHTTLLAQGLVAAATEEGDMSVITGCVHEALRLRAQGVPSLPVARVCWTRDCWMRDCCIMDAVVSLIQYEAKAGVCVSGWAAAQVRRRHHQVAPPPHTAGVAPCITVG